jgi:hypothetical protein
MVHNGNGENQTRTAGYVNRTERAKISISPMLDRYILKHNCNIFGHLVVKIDNDFCILGKFPE